VRDGKRGCAQSGWTPPLSAARPLSASAWYAEVVNATDDLRSSEDEADELVRFFRALPREVRRQYEELAERDRRFGEDLAHERRERGEER
jgi:hypothetical protein